MLKRVYCAACKAKGTKKVRIYRGLCSTCRWIESRHGVQAGAWANMRLLQGDTCEICGQGQSRLLILDRDPATGKVKALLCKRCSNGKGYFPTVKAAEALLKYLNAPTPDLALAPKRAQVTQSPEDVAILAEILALDLSLNKRGQILAERLNIPVASAISRLRRAPGYVARPKNPVKRKVKSPGKTPRTGKYLQFDPLSGKMTPLLEEVEITLDNQGNVWYTP